MPNTRGKLIELLICADDYEVAVCKGYPCRNCKYKGEDCTYKAKASHLIANGVTIIDNQLASSSKYLASSEWISVKDRLPTRKDANETESILAINKDENYVGRWIWDIVARWPDEFTYWMPLPQPPKLGNKPDQQLDECSPQTEEGE